MADASSGVITGQPENGLSAPLRFKRLLRPAKKHPLDGISLEVAGQLDVVMDAPRIELFDHLVHYQGPLAEGTEGGYTLVGTVGTSTITVLGEEYGKIELATSGVEDDNAVLRQLSQTINYSSSDDIIVAMRLSLSDVDDMEFFAGITEDNGDFVAALPAHGLFFEKAETATDLDFHVRNDGTSTENAADFSVTLADDTDLILVIRVENGDITPWVWTDTDGWLEGTTVASDDANIPDGTDDMRLHIAVETGAAAANGCDIDWLYVSKAR